MASAFHNKNFPVYLVLFPWRTGFPANVNIVLTPSMDFMSCMSCRDTNLSCFEFSETIYSIGAAAFNGGLQRHAS